MKNIKLLLFISVLFVNTTTFAQSHDMSPGSTCKLIKTSVNTESHICPACAANDKKEKDSKISKEKREKEILYEEYKKKKEKAEKEREAERMKDLENSKSGEVYINGTSSNTSSSSISNGKDNEEESDITSKYSSDNYIPERVLTQKEKEAEFVQNANQVLNGIANQIEADRLEKVATEKREAERLARNRAYGNELIKKYGHKALQYGDENAVKMTYLGYMNLNEKATEEGNDIEAMEFLENINSNHNSDFAKKQLIDDHLRTINYFDNERKRRTRRTFLHTGLGGALIAGSISFEDSLSSDEMLGADTGPIVLTGVVVFGAYMVMSGIFNSFFIGDYSKSSDKYTIAKNRINELSKKNVKISFSSGYNQRNNNLMVGFDIGF